MEGCILGPKNLSHSVLLFDAESKIETLTNVEKLLETYMLVLRRDWRRQLLTLDMTGTI